MSHSTESTCSRKISKLSSERPFYLPVGKEIEIFRAAFKKKLPVMLKGPTGCGKTRFLEAMAYELGRPLITVACHEDLTASDLVGRYLLKGDETVWQDGPLTEAVRKGAILYLDEIVEARTDTIVVIHPLADHRRELNIERLGMRLTAEDGFTLVVSYNPGYQSVLKDMKISTRQRMVSIELGFPPPVVERQIIVHEAGTSEELAADLVRLGQAIRKLDVPGLQEVSSTRTLISTALLVEAGLPPREAACAAIVGSLTDVPATARGLIEMVKAYLPQ